MNITKLHFYSNCNFIDVKRERTRGVSVKPLKNGAEITVTVILLTQRGNVQGEFQLSRLGMKKKLQ
jgi:hypothetical protein